MTPEKQRRLKLEVRDVIVDALSNHFTRHLHADWTSAKATVINSNTVQVRIDPKDGPPVFLLVRAVLPIKD